MLMAKTYFSVSKVGNFFLTYSILCDRVEVKKFVIMVSKERFFTETREVENPNVAIVILHFSSNPNSVSEKDKTYKCLSSVVSQDYSNMNLVIVDTDSKDSFFEIAKEKLHDQIPDLPQTTMVFVPKNVGYAEGCNIGVEVAIKQNPDFLLLLNNDAIMGGHALSGLVSSIKKESDVVAVAPKIYQLHSRENCCGQREVFQLAGGGRVAFRAFAAGEADHGQWNHRREAEFLSGVSLLIRKEIVEEIGLFDPKLFIWFEDLDWSIRARKAGYKLIYTPHSEVWHEGQQSLKGRYSRKFIYFSTRNLVYLIQKHSGKWRLFLAMRAISVMSKSLIGACGRGNKTDSIQSLAKGFYDGIKLSREEYVEFPREKIIVEDI